MFQFTLPVYLSYDRGFATTSYSNWPGSEVCSIAPWNNQTTSNITSLGFATPPMKLRIDKEVLCEECRNWWSVTSERSVGLEFYKNNQQNQFSKKLQILVTALHLNNSSWGPEALTFITQCLSYYCIANFTLISGILTPKALSWGSSSLSGLFHVLHQRLPRQ